MSCQIEQFLQIKGLSRLELCSMANISPGYLTDIIKNGKAPNLRTAQRIARVLGVPTDTVWPYED